MSVTSLLSVPVGIFQIGQGLTSQRTAEKTADAVGAAAAIDADRVRRQGLLRRRFAQANLGGVALGGSVIDAMAEDALETEFAAQLIVLQGDYRQQRLIAEGEADLLVGIAGGFSTFAQGFATGLDIPLGPLATPQTVTIRPPFTPPAAITLPGANVA